MGVPQKPKTGKKCARGNGKKSCKAAKNPMPPMWGGSPASAMLFQDLANPTNPDNYLDADIPLVANQASARPTMTGGSLTSAAVVGAANTQREPGAMLNDYESAMDLKGCGSKAVMTGGSIASNSVMRHVSLPGVLKPDEVTRMVPDNLSLDPAARPVSSQLTGGGDRPFVLDPVPNREELRNRRAEAEQRRQLLMAEQRRLAQMHHGRELAQDNMERAQAMVVGREQERPRKRKGSSGRRSRGSSGRRSKRKPMNGGGDRPFVLGPVPNREELRNRRARERADRREPAEAEQMQRRAIAEAEQRRQQLMAENRQRVQVGANAHERPRKRKGSSGRRSRGSSGRRSKRKPMNGGADMNGDNNPRVRFENELKQGRLFNRQYALNYAIMQFGGQEKIPQDIIDLINRKFSHSVNNSHNKPMTGGASGFWSGVAGCGPVNVPNAGNTLSKYFTKSSSCPGPDFYANPPNLGTAGSGYATELPAGAPFPFM